MSMRNVLIGLLTAAMWFGAGAGAAAASTHYIASTGSDSADGASKSTPWAHAPGMVTCSANCASYTPAAGDQIIFRGGDAWTNSNFPITWKWSGSLGSQIYIGVDQTWYSGGSWSRPVFNAGGSLVTGDVLFVTANGAYLTLDNIEFTGLYWDSTVSNAAYISLGEGVENWVTNSYFHNWSHASYASGTRDVCTAIAGWSYTETGGASYDLFDGSPSGTDSCAAVSRLPNVDHSIAQNMSNGFLYNDPGLIHDNLVGPINVSFDTAQHENCLEPVAGNGSAGASYVYNNVLHDCTAVSLLAPGTGSPETTYIFNNVFYTSSSSAPIPIQIDDYAPASGISAYLYNNTIATGPTNNVCVRIINRGNGPIGTFDARNNFCVGSGAFFSAGPGATNLTQVTNLVMTPAQATAAGMSAAQVYAYSPNSTFCAGQSSCPVRAGTNESSLASGPLSALGNTTSYACTIGAGNVVSCPARQASARLTSGAWDAGAYQLPAGPNPPTGLQVVTH